MKKKLLFALIVVVLFCSKYSHAQDPLRQKLDLIFGNIDKSKIPTGFLEEYGNPLVPLDVFNGVLTDSNKVDLSVWRQAYSTLYTSRIYGTNPLAGMAAVNTTIGNVETIHNTDAYVNNPNSQTGSIPVTMFYVPYNYLRPDALALNLLYVSNDQLFDRIGRTQSPYLSRIAFAATPTRGFARGGSVSLVFKPELFYNTSSKTIGSMSVDFIDGRGYQAAAWNTPVTSAYTTTGTKRIKIKLTFTDNSVVETYSILEITEVASTLPPVRYASKSPDVTVPLPAEANHSGGNIYVNFDKNDSERTINKPLIIIEGFDAHFVAPEIQKSNFGYSDVVKLLNNSGSFDFTYNLDDQAGYDLIILDYNDGTDDIRRNASLVQEVIEWVNDNKVIGAEDNVVLGISMGGLVSRYALASMTKQGLSTKTRLLITHDSPHRGANTPLGAQFLTRQINDMLVVQLLNMIDVFPQLKQANQLLDRPASQQMSIVRAINESGAVSYNSFLDGEYRSMITFGSTGNQPTYRTIATSLGAECGQQNLPPHTELLRTTGRFFISPIPWIIRRSYNAEIIVNALPEFGTSKRISKVRIWTNYRILSFINVNITLTNKEAYSPTNLLPWDSAPGGAQSIKDQIGSLPSVNFKFLGFIEASLNTIAYQGTFCFIPTVSALDVTTIDAQQLAKSYVDGISPTNPSRMATFIAQKRISATTFNEIHPRFTADNAQWIYSEMENKTSVANALTCSEECATTFAAPNGPDKVCTSDATFSLPIIPAGATVTWSVSPASAVVTSSGVGATAVIKGVTGVRTSATITFYVKTSCRPTPAAVSKTIWIGAPYLSSILGTGELVRYTVPGEEYFYNPSCNLISQTVKMTTSGASGAWSRVTANPTNTQWSISGNNVSFYFYATGQTATFKYVASNTCGTITQYFSFRSVNCGGGGGCEQYSVSPNPSRNTISIVAPNIPAPCGTVNTISNTLMENGATSEVEQQTTSGQTIKSITVIDSKGVVKMIKKYDDDLASIELDISGWPIDVYILKISDGNKTEIHRIIKN